MIEAAYADLFSESVTLYPPASVDAYGKRTFAASGVTVAAHYVAEEALLRSEDGRDVIVKGTFYLYGTPTVTNDYRLVLDDGTEPIIISVDTPHDENGAHHTVIKVGES